MPAWALIVIGIAVAIVLIGGVLAFSFRGERARLSRLAKPSNREDTGPSIGHTWDP